MRWITFSLLCAGLSLGFVGCRASFRDIQKQNLVSSGDDIAAKDNNGKGPDDAPILENTKELPPEESDAYGCDGTVVIHEKGKDRNHDGVLQPTEVTDISTECRANGKDPGTPPPPGGKNPPPPKCPNQNDSSQSDSKGKGKCEDEPGQNIPSQSAGK